MTDSYVKDNFCIGKKHRCDIVGFYSQKNCAHFLCTIVNIKTFDLKETNILLVLVEICKFGLYTIIAFHPERVNDNHHCTNQISVVDQYIPQINGRSPRVLEPQMFIDNSSITRIWIKLIQDKDQ